MLFTVFGPIVESIPLVPSPRFGEANDPSTIHNPENNKNKTD